ncbi:MAG: hypothetical protein M1840_006786 [Geoglossum simile]|nr:MAG: hypothetical protein M1840_006786 [Geoglossum simile]
MPEFDFRVLGDGRSASARYANNSNYRNDSLIRKEMCVSSVLIDEIKRIIKQSEIMKEDDTKWPQKNKDGRQELEIRLGNEHISFETAKIGSLVDVTESADPEGLRVFYYLVQDLKALVFSLISLHFKHQRPMPTPNDETRNESPSATIDPHLHRPQHTSCPPDESRHNAWRMDTPDGIIDAETTPQQQPTPPSDIDSPRLLENCTPHGLQPKEMDTEEDNPVSDMLSPISPSPDTKDVDARLSLGLASHGAAESPSSSTSYEFSNIRLFPNYSSSFLRAGSKFRGTQQSDRQVYDVQVELKHVDMGESFLCGYLRIQGLTEDHPTLTTYFEGEMIGTKYKFRTQNKEWGSTEKVDNQHWNRFPAYLPLAKRAGKSDFSCKNFAKREHIFMRWKEYFLVPDHRVRTISGASFEGFYYICFNQVTGDVSGIYFHSKSENNRYQQLELKRIDDRGCFGAMEFR